jgi:hypothetical protein
MNRGIEFVQLSGKYELVEFGTRESRPLTISTLRQPDKFRIEGFRLCVFRCISACFAVHA